MRERLNFFNFPFRFFFFLFCFFVFVCLFVCLFHSPQYLLLCNQEMTFQPKAVVVIVEMIFDVLV